MAVMESKTGSVVAVMVESTMESTHRLMTPKPCSSPSTLSAFLGIMTSIVAMVNRRTTERHSFHYL